MHLYPVIIGFQKELLKGRDKKLLKKTKKGKSESLFSDEFIESNISKPRYFIL